MTVPAKLSYEKHQFFPSYLTTVGFRLQRAVTLPCTTVVAKKLATLHGELHQ